jgi:nucleotide-binding universal stress UspA family protein
MSQSPAPVLLAYDGSPSSAAAIAAAGRLLPGGRALVCHVWQGLSKTIFHSRPSELPGALHEAAEELDAVDREDAVETAAEGVRLARAAGFEAQPLLTREGRKTWRTLLEAAEHNDASLMVAGAHGMSGIARAVLGSVSNGLVNHAAMPVLIVPETATDEPDGGPLLLCYDGSEPAKRAIAEAKRIFREHRALVLHLWESWAARAPALAGASGAVYAMTAELDEMAEEQSEQRSADGVALAEQLGFRATARSERTSGPLWRTVLETADEHSSPAIVLGSRGLTGLAASLGSVSHLVVHQSHRPVLVVPPQEDR